ncbi:MAG: TonB family protein, partial [Pyrinomonadaceae bacterium]
AAIFILSVVLSFSSLFNFRGNSQFVFQLSLKNIFADTLQTDIAKDTAEDDLLIQSSDRPDTFDISIFLAAASLFYFSYFSYRLFFLLKTWRQTTRLRDSARDVTPSPLIKDVSERCRAAFQMDFVPILFSAEVTAPFTLGARQPLIILPESFLKIDSEKILTAAIGHELAHVRRRDYASNLAFEFFSLFVSFHPAIKIMKRKINQTREMACDELVAETLLNPLDYARSLVEIAGFVSSASQNAFTLGVFSADIMEQRIMKLIEKNRGVSRRAGKFSFLFVMALLAITITITSVFAIALPFKQIQTDNQTNQTETKDTRQDKKRARKKRADGQSSQTQAQNGVTPPHIFAKQQPRYTAQARKNGTSGTVRLQVEFLSSGEIGDVVPLSRLPDGLTESAVEAAKSIKFKPATKKGQSLTVTKIVEYSFANF